MSGAVGPNDSGSDTQTCIYGVDVYWKWKSPTAHGGFPFVSWQTEAMRRDYEAGADSTNALTAETLTDWGLYSQVLWGFHEGWVLGLRGDYVSGSDGQFDQSDVYRGTRDRVSPDLTWYLIVPAVCASFLVNSLVARLVVGWITATVGGARWPLRLVLPRLADGGAAIVCSLGALLLVTVVVAQCRNREHRKAV